MPKTHAEVLYNYHRYEQSLVKADAIFVLGSHDPSVADYAAWLYQQGYSSKIIFSGGVVRINELRNSEPKTEAEALAAIAMTHGVPAEDIIQEKLAMNTGDNFIKTMALLQSQRLDYQSFILVQKPYMLRRTYATAMVQIPDKKFITTAMPDTYESYVKRCESNGISEKRVIDNMVGDLERLIKYPEQGFLVKMDIPNEVLDAYEELIKMGFVDRMIVRC